MSKPHKHSSRKQNRGETYAPIEALDRETYRTIYSLYLNGYTMEAIQRRMLVARRVTVSLGQISHVIDELNDSFL